MSLDNLIQSKEFKTFLTKLYSIGAAVVVFGALFKIQHWPGAGIMLSTGLITEAIIFFFSAFEKDEDSVQEYTQIEEDSGVRSEEIVAFNGKSRGALGEGGGGGSLALSKFDEMLENAEITPDLFQKLGVGMKKLGETAENMNAMGDVSAASTKYMKTIRTADESLGKLAKSYETVITKVNVKTVFKYKIISNSLSIIEVEAKNYQQQMATLNKNLSSLNTIYKLQREGVDDYLNDLMQSAAESKKYREQMVKLNENLSALNSVYGNMLGAMKVK